MKLEDLETSGTRVARVRRSCGGVWGIFLYLEMLVMGWMAVYASAVGYRFWSLVLSPGLFWAVLGLCVLVARLIWRRLTQPYEGGDPSEYVPFAAAER